MFILSAVSSAAGLVTGGSGIIKDVESFLNPGAVRDANREARAQLMERSAIAGSTLAAQIIIAAPANVASNEDGYWETAATHVQAQAPTVWAAAQALGGFWPVGAPFDMPDQRATIAAQLNAIGANVPQPSQPLTPGPTGEVVTVKPGPAVTNAAQGAANAAGFQLIPNGWLVFGGLLLAVGAVFFMKRKGS